MEVLQVLRKNWNFLLASQSRNQIQKKKSLKKEKKIKQKNQINLFRPASYTSEVC